MLRFLQLISLCLFSATAVAAPSTLEPEEGAAWSESVGWLNAADGSYGLVVKQAWLEGYAWSENVGWISFGEGPVDGLAYTQQSGDTGVNRSVETGMLEGYAWSENTGWIRFGANVSENAAMDDAGVFSGYAWSENLGWVSLGELRRAPDNEWDGLKDSWDPDDDNDRLPDVVDGTPFDATNGLADDDSDGQDNGSEYVAGTDSQDASSLFRVYGIQPEAEGGFRIQWESVVGKTYRIMWAAEVGGSYVPVGSDILAVGEFSEVVDAFQADSAFYKVTVVETAE
ncbi:MULTISPECIES: hypothetical protein [unclassified Lentimonas]|uniref:hypothetical protein n=1 Tax=unclassified Lentimonas TaxID=2630993 RepID=UPI001327DC32|nr:MULTISPECIES: hypothetical protein [unclassified Lentimonas]CAA6680023.1 Unannotated [Lentimonas sp. CC4]CAA6685142.1 Unannotated [Lentimonas sp. CC6]CAA7075132.1 Unannotated [Lentimonas sp. CC4]CAA7168408.1 Unannotated [Lentimonas sp. CC21]CAA7182157.1 Unannotated [Lentimonas sp. CC8]